MKQSFRAFSAYLALLGLGALAVGVIHPDPPKVFAQPNDQRCFQGGHEVRCSDGKFHDWQTGAPQPDSCANFETAETETKDCHCAREKMAKEACDMPPDPGDECKTRCREHDCKCQGRECS